MAIAITCIFEVNGSASDNNGGGFDPAQTMATDLAATSGTGTAPVVTSASYNFVAGDVNAYLFVKSGTNWTPGWYKITSVSSNAATLDAAVGHVVLYQDSKSAAMNTVAGVATTASPTSGTWSVDYSRGTSAQFAFTDMVIDGTTNTKFTSAAHPVGPNFVGNTINITSGTGFTVQSVSVNSVSGTTATCDKSLGTLSSTGGTGNLGGAKASPGGAAAVINAIGGGGSCDVFILGNNTYEMTTTSNVSGGKFNVNFGNTVGYNTNRYLANQDSPRPIIQPASGNNSFTLLNSSQVSSVIIGNLDIENAHASTSITAINCGSSNNMTLYNIKIKDCKTVNTNLGVGCNVIACTAINATDTTATVFGGSNGTWFYGCSAINCKSSANGCFSGVNNANAGGAIDCIVAGNNGSGPGFFGLIGCYNCVAYSITGALQVGIGIVGPIVNCITDNCTIGYGSSSSIGPPLLINCADYNSTTPYDKTHYIGVYNFIQLTADPFVTPGTTIGADFTLNAATYGGALVRALSLPISFPGLSSTNYRDIGAIQHQGSTGSANSGN
jgi:hypothetical protein